MSEPGRTTEGTAFSRVLSRALIYGALLAAVIAVVGATVGGVVDGWRGVVSGAMGAALALIFMGLTAISILVVNRFSGSPYFGAVFFVVVMGTWLLKLVVFLVLVFVLRGAPWINPVVLFVCIVAGVLGSLAVDVIVAGRGRVPYVEDRRRQ